MELAVLLLLLPLSLANKPPNIIFILTDDQGYADVGFTNPSSPFVTPNIDALAANAVRLTDYYVHPTCTPTRAALMTGRYASNVGLPLAFVPGSPGGLDPSIPLLPEHLASLGYQNYLVGKWHLGNAMEKFHPLNRGFHHFYGLLGGGLNFYTKQCGSGRLDWWRERQPEWDNTTHVTDLLNREALSIVDKHLSSSDSQPFFIYLAHPAPHDPLLAEPRHIEQCAHIRNTNRRLSCALVAGIDEGVGQLKDRLNQAGVLEDTIIIFSSDNGGVPYAGALNYPFRGAKTGAYEGGVRSPGFLHLPRVLGGGRDFPGLAHVSDFFPTLSSLVAHVSSLPLTSYHFSKEKSRDKSIQTSKLDNIDGVDLFPAMLSRSPSPRKAVHIHRDPSIDSQVYRRGKWKIIVGHHYMPFLFTKVYNETADSVWGMDGGSWRGVLLQSVLTVMDTVIGLENSLFVKYLLWMTADSVYIGGLGRLQAMRSLMAGEPGGATDLEFWRGEHSLLYPTVSLFDLEANPQEVTNLASLHPGLVEELLKEAEELVKDAPSSVMGDRVHTDSPQGPQAGTLYDYIMSLGTRHSQVVPYGPYLADDTDISTLTYNDGFIGNANIKWVLAKLLLLGVILPLVLLWWTVRKLTNM